MEASKLQAYSKYSGVLDFQLHPVAKQYITSEASIRALIKGNQGGGTTCSVYDTVLRLLGIHPVKKRNILNKPIRFVSKCLPKSDSDEENQQYVEFKKMFPSEFIKKDITARSSMMAIRNPSGASDRKVEFMSSSQDLDAFMSVQRSVLIQDEEIDRIKWDDCQMRLLKENGDSTICLTPVKGLDWTFDSIWKKANTIYRSDTICEKFGYKPVEKIDVLSDTEAFCWATDDNPVMDKLSIERIFQDIDDPDELAMRRYGVFKQVSGKIYKSFEKTVHVKKTDDYFDASLFRTYWNYRVIDFHQAKPWYVTFVVVTPQQEWIVWHEMLAKHDNKTTVDIRDDIKNDSLLDEDELFNRATIIDPLACIKQNNTGFSVFQDISIGEHGIRRLVSADTKNSQGRMNIKMRLKNALVCGVPGNNLNKTGVFDERYSPYLPTIWFLDNCRGHIDHFDNWRYLNFVHERVRATRTIKRETEKYSDFCRNLEFLGALNPVYYPLHRNKDDSDNYYSSTNFFNANRHSIAA